MRVDPHDAQQIKGEISAAKQQLSVATLECQRARVRLAELRRELVAMRRRDAQYWDEIEREFPAGLSSQDSDLESPVSRQAIEEAAPSVESERARRADGAALDTCEHAWVIEHSADAPTGWLCAKCGKQKPITAFRSTDGAALDNGIGTGHAGEMLALDPEYSTIYDRGPRPYTE